MRNATYLVIALSFAAAACGEKASVPGKAGPKEAVPAEATKPVETPKPAEAPKPAAPAETPKPSGALQPAPDTAPTARVTKDAKGHDWASHMGDIAFTFDSCAAAKRAEDEKRALMLFFTAPS